MDEESFRVKQGQAIPGEEIHRYLESYAIRFNVLPKLRFQTKVRTVEQNGDAGWKVHVVMDVDGTPKSSKLFTKKLIVATGLCSEPLRVELPGMDQFGGPIFHIQGFRAHSDVLQKADTITVLGSSKSTWDVAYEFAANGVQVEWVIRESGHGPIWHSPPYVTPLKKWLEKLVFTRLLTCFSPSIWEDADGYGWIRRLFHGTFVGRFFVNLFWKILENDLVTLNRYDEHPETKKLKPWKAAFWTGNSLSILNYPTSIFELVKRGQIHVHVADIVQLSCG